MPVPTTCTPSSSVMVRPSPVQPAPVNAKASAYSGAYFSMRSALRVKPPEHRMTLGAWIS